MRLKLCPCLRSCFCLHGQQPRASTPVPRPATTPPRLYPPCCAGLTEGEKDEGEKAKQAIQEEQGGDGENVSDEEMGNHKAAGQFFTHLKKNEVRCARWACMWGHLCSRRLWRC